MVFTPRDAITDQRLTLDISSSDMDALECARRTDTVTITDRITGAHYAVTQAPCSLPHCYCDAVARRLSTRLIVVGAAMGNA